MQNVVFFANKHLDFENWIFRVCYEGFEKKIVSNISMYPMQQIIFE